MPLQTVARIARLLAVAVGIIATAVGALAQSASPPPDANASSRAVYVGLGSFGAPLSLNYEYTLRSTGTRLTHYGRFIAGGGAWSEVWLGPALDTPSEFVYFYAGGTYAAGRAWQAEVGGVFVFEGGRERDGTLVVEGYNYAPQIRPFIGGRYEGKTWGLRLSVTYAPPREDEVSPFAKEFVPGVGVGYRF